MFVVCIHSFSLSLSPHPSHCCRTRSVRVFRGRQVVVEGRKRSPPCGVLRSSGFDRTVVNGLVGGEGNVPLATFGPALTTTTVGCASSLSTYVRTSVSDRRTSTITQDGGGEGKSPPSANCQYYSRIEMLEHPPPKKSETILLGRTSCRSEISCRLSATSSAKIPTRVMMATTTAQKNLFGHHGPGFQGRLVVVIVVQQSE